MTRIFQFLTFLHFAFCYVNSANAGVIELANFIGIQDDHVSFYNDKKRNGSAEVWVSRAEFLTSNLNALDAKLQSMILKQNDRIHDLEIYAAKTSQIVLIENKILDGEKTLKMETEKKIQNLQSALVGEIDKIGTRIVTTYKE